MTSNRPYLIRAMFDWIVDNGLTPHLLVDAEVEGVVVPQRFVEDGRIVLNVSPSAVAGMVLGNDDIHFSARFGGSPHRIELPTRAVLGIFARENSHGMLFPDDADAEATDESEQPSPSARGSKRAGPAPRLVDTGSGRAGARTGAAARGGSAGDAGDAGKGATTKTQASSKLGPAAGPKPDQKSDQKSDQKQGRTGPKPDSPGPKPGPKPGGKPGRPSLKIVK